MLIIKPRTMKKSLVSILILSLLFNTSFAQSIINAEYVNAFRKKIDSELLDVIKGNNTSSRRSVNTFELDYTATDQIYSASNNHDFDYTLNPLNSNYSVALPFDTADNFTLKWAAVKFDTIYDYINQVSYPLVSSTITIDSIYFLFQHQNVTGQNDTLVISVLEIEQTPSGLITSNQGISLNNSILWSDTTITNVSLTPGLSGSQMALYHIKVNYTLPIGKGFIIQLNYKGPKQDKFFIVDGNRDECNNTCFAAQSVIPDNSYAYLNFIQAQTNLSGIPNLMGLSADCNQDGVITSDGCEFYYLQNIAVWTKISVDAPLSISTSQNTFLGCPGTNETLSVSGIGGTAPYNYLWSNGQTSANINVVIGSINETYSVTVTDADNSSATTSFLIISNGLSVDFGNNITIACGQVIDLEPTVNGNTAGISYNWNTGEITSAITIAYASEFSLTVTNSDGCVAVDTINVNLNSSNQQADFSAPAQAIINCPIDFINQSTNVNDWNFTWDFGDGSIFFDSDVTYSWSMPGTYIVTLAADSSNCLSGKKTAIDVVAGTCSSCGIQIAGNIFNTSTASSANGQIFVTVTNGTSPYIYLWSNGATTQNIDTLLAGIYSVTVTDAAGCVAISTFVVSIDGAVCSGQFTSPGIYPHYSQIPCILQGENYQLELTLKNTENILGIMEWLRVDSIAPRYLSGITFPFTGLPQGIIWNMIVPSGNPANQLYPSEQGCINLFGATNAPIGQYEMTIYTCVKTLLSPTPFCGELNSIMNDLANTTGTINPYSPYYLNVCSPTNCNAYLSYSIYNASVSGTSDGLIEITINDGLPPYTYQWSNGATTQNLSNVPAGIYSVTATDANGCNVSESFEIYNDIVKTPHLISSDEIVVYPSPTDNSITLILSKENVLTKNSRAVLYDSQGKILFDTPITQHHSEYSILQYPKGIYLLKVLFDDASTINKRIVKM